MDGPAKLNGFPNKSNDMNLEMRLVETRKGWYIWEVDKRGMETNGNTLNICVKLSKK